MRGVNAAVVGLLGAALYNPVWTSAVQGARGFRGRRDWVRPARRLARAAARRRAPVRRRRGSAWPCGAEERAGSVRALEFLELAEHRIDVDLLFGSASASAGRRTPRAGSPGAAPAWPS